MSLILSGTDGLSDVDGSAATPAIRGTDANTGIFFGTDIIGFSEGGVEAMRINASGNVEMVGTLTTASRGIAKASMPAGAVLQVVQTVKTDTFTTTSTTYTDVTGISVSITPTSATSKILVFANLNASVTATDNYFAFQLVRGSTAISIGDTAGSRTVGSVGSALLNGTGSANYILPMAINFLDSPATTSATTYKIQGLVQSGQTLVLNRSGTDSDAVFGIRTASTITVMEIAA